MSKTKRYFPTSLLPRKNYRYWINHFSKFLKKEVRSKRKTMKTKDVGDGSNYNKQAGDPWNWD